MAGLSGEVVIKAGPGEIRGLGIPELKEALLPATDDDAGDRTLTLPFSEIDAKGALGRGILDFEDSRLRISSATGEETDAVIEGTADLLLWIADLTVRSGAVSTGAGSADAVGVYRLVGPPDRPAGRTSAGN